MFLSGLGRSWCQNVCASPSKTWRDNQVKSPSNQHTKFETKGQTCTTFSAFLLFVSIFPNLLQPHHSNTYYWEMALPTRIQKSCADGLILYRLLDWLADWLSIYHWLGFTCIVSSPCSIPYHPTLRFAHASSRHCSWNMVCSFIHCGFIKITTHLLRRFDSIIVTTPLALLDHNSLPGAAVFYRAISSLRVCDATYKHDGVTQIFTGK